MSPVEERMLALLTDEPQRPGNLGSALWGDKPRAYRCWAGEVLNRLQARGLARRAVVWGRGGWVLERSLCA